MVEVDYNETASVLLQLDGGLAALRGLTGRLRDRKMKGDLKERIEALAAYVRSLPR